MTNASNPLLLLEIGCGKTPRPGYITCDIRNLPDVDVVCDAGDLPFERECVDEIFTRHMIEHFTLKEFLKVLEEWNRVLKPGGVLYVICPNLIWHLKQIVFGDHESFYDKTPSQNYRYWGFGSLFGWQQSDVDIHKFGYYFELLRDILEDFGFGEIRDLTNSGSGMENEPWHLEVRAVKKRDCVGFRKSRFWGHFDVEH